MARIFGGIRAPSTLGTYLRAFTHGHVQQLDAVGTRVLAGLAEQAPALIAGAEHAEGLAFLDIDDTIREVHGYAKQGAAYGYSKVRGLNAQLAVLSTPLAAPVIAGARLRRGNVASATGAGRMLARRSPPPGPQASKGGSSHVRTRPTTATRSSGPRCATAPGSA